MKKIITAAAVAALAASFAAAEAKFSVNYRTGIDLLQHQMTKGTRVFDNQASARSTSDALSFKGSAEYGGLELEIDPEWYEGSVKKSQTLTLKKYNGWINFGNFMIKSGAWDSRAVGRVNADIGNHEGSYWGELLKPGLAVAGGTAGNGKDISQQSNNKQTTMVQYKNKDLGLEVRAAYRDTDGSKKTFASGDENDDWVAANDLWFGEVAYTINDIGRVMATGKFAHKDYAGALFFEPKLADMKELTSLVGFIYETKTNAGKDKSGDDVAANTMAVELRARYDLGAFVKGLSATFMYNWTFGNTVTSDAKKPGFYAEWAMLNLKYALNDTFNPFLSVLFSNGAWSANTSNDADLYMKPSASASAFDEAFTYSMRVFGGVEIYNTKNANIITGICWDAANMNDTVYGGDCTKVVSIPVLMRVKF